MIKPHPGSSLLVIVLFTPLWFGSCTQEPVLPPLAGTHVIAFGDSLVRGVGASPGKGWVSLLSTRLDRPILNKGKNGDTTRSALSRLPRDVLTQDPRVVLILLGGNDALRHLPQQLVFENLAATIDQIQQVGARVVLIGVRGGPFIDHYAKSFRALADEKNVLLVTNILGGIWGNQQRMADMVHPNDEGYRLMADRIEPVLVKALGSRS